MTSWPLHLQCLASAALGVVADPRFARDNREEKNKVEVDGNCESDGCHGKKAVPNLFLSGEVADSHEIARIRRRNPRPFALYPFIPEACPPRSSSIFQKFAVIVLDDLFCSKISYFPPGHVLSSPVCHAFEKLLISSGPAWFPPAALQWPPPKPPHIRVNPQDWQNGTWSINPAFNSSQWSLSSNQSQSSQSWIPSQAWHQQRQQEWQVQQQQMAAAASFNPYKRVPRPPSAEYLATKLSDNPLGLTNMVPREELFGTTEDGIPAATPWVWNPRGLEPDDTEENTSTNSRRPEPPPPASAPAHGGYGANGPPPMYARHSQPREMSDPTPQSQRRNSMPARHSSEPPRPPSTDTLPTLDRPLDRPRQYQRDGPSYQPETFTATRELQLTFSSNIVRTPQHYKSRSSSTGPQPQSIYAQPSRGSIDSQLASRMEQLSTQQTNALSRQSSLPAPLSAPPTSSSMSGVASFVDEPASILSPLVLPTTTHKHSSRALGRHSSVPVVGTSTSLSAIPESPNDSRRRSPHRSPHHAQRRSRHTSPVPPVPGPVLTHSRHTSPSTPAPQITPPRPNPLPDPPQEFGRNPGITLPVQRTPPSSYRVALRKGMWNRRGDHLTIDGFIVYAPVDRAYPDELRDYPAETVGYRDHLGAEIGYLASRPELPESLPRYGQPPRQPYEKFVVYEYMQ
ncbi:hypothetical protein B0H19DRAFT_1064888 [Mycena capillaripes]|nr:hypothetical protein B0H19DRAFT_1064888 [Mycena capillaripes]